MKFSEERLKKVLDDIEGKRIGVVGDGCVDIYWEADMKLSRLSRETPHYPLPVVEERHSLGAAGNVAANLRGIGASVEMLTYIGDDWRGDIFTRLIREKGIGESYILRSQERITPAYCKPMRRGISQVVYEDPRLDFENYHPMSSVEDERFVEALLRMADEVDAIAVSDQFNYGVVSERVRGVLEGLGRRGRIVVVDSREDIASYKNVIIKPNEVEAPMIVGEDLPSDYTLKEVYRIGRRLREVNGEDLIITLGDRGAVWVEDEREVYVPTVKEKDPIDIVGCGDAFLAGFISSYSTGIDPEEAVEFANLTAGVVVRKIGTTGTASPGEIRAKYRDRRMEDGKAERGTRGEDKSGCI